MATNTTNNTREGGRLYPKSEEWILIEGDANPWQLFYVSVAKSKASFGPTILVKAMAAETTTNKNSGEGLYPKSGDWLLMEGGGQPPAALLHWILSP